MSDGKVERGREGEGWNKKGRGGVSDGKVERGRDRERKKDGIRKRGVE